MNKLVTKILEEKGEEFRENVVTETKADASADSNENNEYGIPDCLFSGWPCHMDELCSRVFEVLNDVHIFVTILLLKNPSGGI